MYTIQCKDVEGIGVKGCDYVAEGRSKEEAASMAKEHFENEHPEEFEEAQKKYPPEELDRMLEESAQEEDEDEDNDSGNDEE